MLSLHHIIWIKELTPHQSVEGVTREVVYPHDLLEIEDVKYRVNSMFVEGGNYHFTATKI